jgi:hypothetical protein
LSAQLASATASADDLARVAAALAVSNALAASNRTDPSILRLFFAAALSGDSATRQAAVEQARAGGDPPAAGAAGVSAPGPLSGPAAPQLSTGEATRLMEYRSKHLIRDALNLSGVAMAGNVAVVTSVHTWGVYDGNHAPIRTGEFATMTGDSAMLDQLRHRRKVGTVAAVVAGAVGVALLADSAYYWHINSIAPYSAPQWSIALGVGTTEVLVGVGALTGAALTPWAIHRRQQLAYLYYDIPRADELITRYNAKLAEDLGLTPEQASSIDLSH